jgi:hypothetical protein
MAVWTPVDATVGILTVWTPFGTPGFQIRSGTPRAFTCARLPAVVNCCLLEETTLLFPHKDDPVPKLELPG